MYDDSDFLFKSKEEWCCFIWIWQSAGHPIVFKILWNSSNKVVHWSNIQPANTPLDKNACLDSLTASAIVTS